MKLDINAVHIIAIIVLGAIAITLVWTHQTTMIAGIIQFIIGVTGVSFVPAALRAKTPTDVMVDELKAMKDKNT
jgi:hypothetical protein